MKKHFFFTLGLMMMALGAQQVQAVDLSTLHADYTIQNGESVTGTKDANNSTTFFQVAIAANATITLSNASIMTRDHDPNPCLKCLGDAKIILYGTNTLRQSYSTVPAIFVPEGHTLTICLNDYEDPGTLMVSCGGTAPAIGAGANLNCGNIRIEGGTINATGGTGCPAIGGAEGATCGNITITDGVTSITANKGTNAYYSIGRFSASYMCGTITIGSSTYTNGITTSPYTYTPTPWNGNLATLNRNVAIKSDMRIYGTLNGNSQRYKISVVRDVNITLDNVTITGKNLSACPWAGLNVLSNVTLILKGENSITGFYSDYPGIYVEYGTTLKIREHADGGSLYASCSNIGGGGAGIGGGKNLDCGSVWIYGGTIEAEGGKGAGIGSGQNAQCQDVGIYGGTITAGGRFGAAAIGAGLDGTCPAVRITPDVTNVTATATGSNAQYSIKANTVRVGCDQHGNGGTTYSTGITTNPFVYPEPEPEPEPCLAPTGVQVNNITTSSATLTFTPGSSDQTLWYVKCRPAGTVANIFAGLVNQTTVNFTELDPSTEYEVQVYAECENNNSDPTEWLSFTTESDEPEPEPCPAVTDLQVTNVTSTSATVTFTPGSEDQTEWWVDCHKPSSILDRIYAEWVSETSVTISDLEPNTDYEIYVKAKCGTETSNTKMRSFTTLEEGVEPEPCLAPTDVEVSNITSTSATVTFTPGSEDQTTWMVYCYIENQSIVYQGYIYENTATIENLQPNTEYKVTIKADCGEETSDWATDVPFTTLEEGVDPEPCLPVTNVIVSDITSTSAAVSFTPGSEDQTKWLVYCYIPGERAVFTEYVEETSVTIPDLEPNTEYMVTVMTRCDEEVSDWATEVPFTTLEETGIEEIVDGRSSLVDGQKILHEGHLYFLRDGKLFNAQGARVK